MKSNLPNPLLFYGVLILLVALFLLVSFANTVLAETEPISKELLKAELKEELKAELKEELKAELKEELKAELKEESNEISLKNISTESVKKEAYFIDIQNGQITEPSLWSICYYVAPQYELQPELLFAMCEKESTRFVNAQNGSCKGLMQVSTKWHQDRMQRLGVTDIYDPYGNVLLAADFMHELMQVNGDIRYALMRYNMAISIANERYANGNISNYALSIIARAKELHNGIRE